tara:strand:- start:455 stop:721 length:267 start_codon:yes stop_codon:yes gene_type:complete
MLNKLGHYIFKRICKDQERLRKKQSMNMYGMYVRPKDIQRYINDYLEYGYDYTGDDNIAADDKVEHYLEEFFEPTIDKYWDEPEGEES